MRILMVSVAIALWPSMSWASPQCCGGAEGARGGCRCGAKSGEETSLPARVNAAEAQRKGGGPPAGRGMSATEHQPIQTLLSQHKSILRVVEELPNGVRTTTTTDRPELVKTLRLHVRQMAERLAAGRPVRMWDPTFREVFAHADEITLKWKDVERGIEVTETSDDPQAVAAIRAHAKKVDEFAARGHAAARPPWAPGPGH